MTTAAGAIAETPMDRLDGFASALDLPPGSLLMKRDDLIGIAGGGNKVRKDLVAIRSALEAGAATVVTTGAPQSNHVRVVAGLAARAGLGAVLVLEGAARTATGNLVLDGLFGAEVVWSGDEEPAAVAARLTGERGAALIPFGGSDPVTAEAYRAAGQEILRQAPGLSRVVTAIGSGGTMAGLVAALGHQRVLGVDTGALAEPREVVASLLSRMDAGVPPMGLEIDPDQVGTGYADLQPQVREAMRLLARTEAIVVDPVYTGRMVAGVLAGVRAGRIRADETTVLLHSGGLPGLFGHACAAALAS